MHGLQYFLSGIYALNLILSGGLGFATRQIYEFFGAEGVGKTTLVLETLGVMIHHYNAIVFFYDQETPTDPRRFAQFRMVPYKFTDDPKEQENPLGNFHYCHAESVETLFMAIDSDLKKLKQEGNTRPVFIAIDSLNAVMPQQHVDLKSLLDHEKVGEKAKAWGFATKAHLTKHWLNNNWTLFLTNHVMDLINTGGYGPKTGTPGGRQSKHYGTVRMELKRKGKIKTAEGVVIGQEVQIQAVKNKLAPPFNIVRLPLYFGNPTLPTEKNFVGIWDDLSCLYFLEDRGAITTRGGWKSVEIIEPTTGEILTIKFQMKSWSDKVMKDHKIAVYTLMKNVAYGESVYSPL